MMRDFALSLSATALVIAAAWSGLTVSLGAHPFWAVKIALIGAPVGAAAALVLRRFVPPAAALIASVLGLATSLASATYGKRVFAASFAEDALAGKFWFFGWIGAAMAATLVLALIVPRR
jgi:hypothetical protein